MRVRTQRRFQSFALLGLAIAGFAGCAKSEPPRIQLTDVEKCERGIQDAIHKPTLQEGLRTYYAACADVYAEPGCKKGVSEAVNQPPEAQLAYIADACRKAYCPTFADRGFEICQGGEFGPKAKLERNWSLLHQAILERDAKTYAPRLSNLMVAFYVKTQVWMPVLPPVASPSGDFAASAPDPSASAAPGASGSASAPAASGSAPRAAASVPPLPVPSTIPAKAPRAPSSAVPPPPTTTLP